MDLSDITFPESKMSIFGFGKKKDNAPSTGDAIQRLRETEDMLLRKQVQRHEFLKHFFRSKLLYSGIFGEKNRTRTGNS